MEINLLTTNGSADFLPPPGVPPWDKRKGLYALAWSQIESPDPDKRLSDHRPVFARLRLEGCASKSA